MFDHLADPNPPIETAGIRRHVEQRVRRRRRWRVGGTTAAGAALAITVVVAVFVSAGGGATRVTVTGSSVATEPGRGAAAASFLTVNEPSARSVRASAAEGVELQERSLLNGQIEAVLLKYPSVHTLTASFEPDGNVLAAVQTSQCGGNFYSINPATRAVKKAGSLSSSVAVLSGLTVSPNGNDVSYVAYPGCQSGTPTPTTIAAAHGPPTSTSSSEHTYVAVENLQTGATTQIPLAAQGDVPGQDPVWSPDGTELAMASPGDNNSILIFLTAHPDLRSARTLRLPPTCSINAVGAWTASGITVSLTCHGPASTRGAATSTSLLEQITPAGHVTYSQAIPDCLAVNSIESSLPGGPAIVDAVNSFPSLSGGSCSAPATRISEYTMGRLRTIVNLASTELTMPN